MKLWSGRFGADTNSLVDELNASISFDIRLFREDIAGSVAHAEMLSETGIISPEESAQIVEGLIAIRADIESGALSFTQETEDIHMSVETELTRRIGEAGKKLHTGRSRNDQVALDLRLYLKRESADIRILAIHLLSAILGLADRGMDVIMPAYTHLQRAQPTTFSHYMMAYANMLTRDITRLEDLLSRMDECPLGSGALTGTTYPIDRRLTAGKLGFARITQNSIDGVSDRDFVLELMSALSIMMMHLSRFAEEIILWCSWEFKFIELDDSFATGSSIMPQKKNPDVAELIRGKTGRVFGDLITLFTVMKALPLAYNKDMQEDKEPVFDAVDTVKKCLPVFTAMLDTIKLNAENMRRAVDTGFLNATDCADYLARKGLPFRDAYSVTGRLVARCVADNKTLSELTLRELREASALFDSDVYAAISPENCVEARNVPGGPSRESVSAQMDFIASFISARSEKE